MLTESKRRPGLSCPGHVADVGAVWRATTSLSCARWAAKGYAGAARGSGLRASDRPLPTCRAASTFCAMGLKARSFRLAMLIASPIPFSV